MINRENIQNLVKLFYKPTFKTFYVNSEDGKDFSKPSGVFISLGMTTSKKTLENIRDFVSNSGKYRARLAEISSKKIDDQYINTLINLDNPSQYKLDKVPENVLTKEEVFNELDLMKNKMTPSSSLELITEYSYKVNKLQHLADRLDESNGWNSHMIQKDGDLDYRIFHLFVNYEKREGVEYRLGIFVDENSTEDD